MLPSATVQTAYIGLFGLTALICFGGLARLPAVDDPDVRRGLKALLLLSGAWATAETSYLVAPDRLAVGCYTAGLVIGLATVGAWLYFCSAYAGRRYHRRPLYRRLAVAGYLAVVGFKLTNVWHGLYFETAVITTPFRHVAVRKSTAFWIIAGASYVLSALGFYLLVDAFEARRSTPRKVKFVVALAALPVGLDVVGYLSPLVLGLNYESVGVGLFALGALYAVREPFLAVGRYGRPQLLEALDDPVVILDGEGCVRDHNAAAARLFPALTDGGALPAEAVVDRTDPLQDGGTIELERDGERRHFLAEITPITVGTTDVGRGVVYTDVTAIVRQRRRLREKDEQLEGFATAITHELRNSVGIIGGHADLLARAAEEADDSELEEHAAAIAEEATNIEGVVEELQALARYSQTVSGTTTLDLGELARAARRRADTDVELSVERSVDVEASRERLVELLGRVIEFADRNGASTVAVRGHDDGFSVAYDDRSLTGFDESEIFAYGNAVPNAETAMLLPNVRTLATSHGWSVSIDDDPGGTELDVRSAETAS